jgi:hypothetical protein
MAVTNMKGRTVTEKIRCATISCNARKNVIWCSTLYLATRKITNPFIETARIMVMRTIAACT